MAVSSTLQAPWYVFADIQNTSSGSPYSILDSHPDDRQRVVTWYQQSPVPGFGIQRIRVIHNPNMGRMFQGRVDLLEQRHGKPAFAPQWKAQSTTPQEAQHREKTLALFKQQAAPHPYPAAPHVSLLPLWHSTNPTLLDSLFTTGYANLATTDSGFFGKGLYNTYEAEYAHRVYSKGALLVNFVATYSVFPVIDGDMPKLTGKGNYQNYDGHYIPVVPKNPHNPQETVYYPCKPHQKPHYTELVVFDASQVLPRYLVELSPLLTTPVSSTALDVNNLVTALLEYQFTLDEQDAAYILIDHQITLYAHAQRPLSDKEVALHGLMKRTVAANQEDQKALFHKKITQLLQQLNGPVPTPSPTSMTHSMAPSPVKPMPIIPPVAPIVSLPPLPQAPISLPLAPFGKQAWATCFGDIGSEPPLPPNIQQILNAPCPIWPGKQVYETHLLVLVPQTVNGKPLTLKTLGELVKKPLQGHATKYRYFHLGEYTDPPTAASHWTLMSRDVIPNSRKKNYAAQKMLVQEYAGYEIPQILEAAVVILGEYVRIGGTQLYRDNPNTYTRCQEKWNKDRQLALGGFDSGGLLISHDCDDELESLGVGVFRKF